MPKKSAKRPRWPLIVMALGIVFIVVAAGSFLYFSSNQNQPVSPTETVGPVSADSIERVSAADAFAALTAQEAVFVDVRSAEEYTQSHIEGAVSIPLLELPNRVGELNPDDWIITY